MHYLKLNRANLLFFILVFSLWGCEKKTKYSACFTLDKSTISVGDSVTISNCSEFDGGFTESYWDFGDGESVYTKGNTSLKHAYSNAGEFSITLTVGEKENLAGVSKDIIVK